MQVVVELVHSRQPISPTSQPSGLHPFGEYTVAVDVQHIPCPEQLASAGLTKPKVASRVINKTTTRISALAFGIRVEISLVMLDI